MSRDGQGWQHTAARVVLAVAAVFCATLVVLMLASVVQMRLAPPLDTPELEALRELVRQEPARVALQEQVQALDLLARRAHFSSMRALRVGGGLLLAGLAVLMVAAHMVRETTISVREPDGEGVPEGAAVAAGSRRALVAGLGALVVLALLIPLMKPGPRGRGPFMDGVDDADVPLEVPRSRGPESTTTCAWPAFRGPGGLGVAADANPPLAWDGSSGSNVIWRVPLPRPGFSSPIVCGTRVFLTGGDATLREVYGFDAESGALVWRHPVTGVSGTPGELPEVTDDTGYAAPTMAAAGERLFAAFATGEIVALDREGRRLWARHLGVPDNPYGHASSLITFEELLLVQRDDNAGGVVMALSVADGHTVWSVTRDVELPSWASPVVMESARGPELVLNGNPLVVAYDPRSGAERWRHDCMEGEVAVSVAATEGIVFVANEYARLVALRIGSEPEVLWESLDDLPDVSSPVAGSNVLFMATNYGAVTCRDTATGALHWSHEFKNGFYASPILVGDRLYLTDMEGVTHVMRVGSTFELLASNALGERATSTAAFAGERIYLRGAKHLFCIGAAHE